MTEQPTVVWKHPGVADSELVKYLRDSVRPLGWQALPESEFELDGVWYRGRSTPQPEADIVRSWASDPSVANHFGKYVVPFEGKDIHPIALVSYGTWTEVVGTLR